MSKSAIPFVPKPKKNGSGKMVNEHKTVSHGTYRCKRKPNSKRCKNVTWTIYNQSSSALNIHDESALRASAGVGISWVSPFGPVKFYLSKALLKENYDKKEIFRFSFGTTY